MQLVAGCKCCHKQVLLDARGSVRTGHTRMINTCVLGRATHQQHVMVKTTSRTLAVEE